MMLVINKKSRNLKQVYDITYDTKGYPHFLIYENNQWKRVSAKYYCPYIKSYYSEYKDPVLEKIRNGEGLQPIGITLKP